jgi:hypothetical protein
MKSHAYYTRQGSKYTIWQILSAHNLTSFKGSFQGKLETQSKFKTQNLLTTGLLNTQGHKSFHHIP